MTTALDGSRTITTQGLSQRTWRHSPLRSRTTEILYRPHACRPMAYQRQTSCPQEFHSQDGYLLVFLRQAGSPPVSLRQAGCRQAYRNRVACPRACQHRPACPQAACPRRHGCRRTEGCHRRHGCRPYRNCRRCRDTPRYPGTTIGTFHRAVRAGQTRCRRWWYTTHPTVAMRACPRIPPLLSAMKWRLGSPRSFSARRSLSGDRLTPPG